MKLNKMGIEQTEGFQMLDKKNNDTEFIAFLDRNLSKMSHSFSIKKKV